jgi:hypothetical protein
MGERELVQRLAVHSSSPPGEGGVTLPASAEAHGDVARAALHHRPRFKNRSRRCDLFPTVAYRLGRDFVHHY